MSFLELENVTKIYPNGTKAVDETSLNINEGELMVFVGPSGCGKSTLLRMIAGLEDITDGEIKLDRRAHEYSVLTPLLLVGHEIWPLCNACQCYCQTLSSPRPFVYLLWRNVIIFHNHLLRRIGLHQVVA
mgnify:CR=1 FL=1